MDRGKGLNKFRGGGNTLLYMELKDILREKALHFLPAKSLAKFRTVCRDWKLQISAPFFEHYQSISSCSTQGMFCQSPGSPPIFIPFDPSSCGVPDPSLGFLPDAVDIRSSSNGLLLCQASSGDRAYYVCNPVTQKFKKIPKPTADHGPHPSIVLIFEPSLLNFEAEYKIVCAFASADFDDATEFEIYSSRDGSWKTSGAICFASLSAMPKEMIYANGVAYFTAGKTHIILSYDVAKDRSQVMNKYYHSYGGIVGVVNGKPYSAVLTGCKLQLGLLVKIPSNSRMPDIGRITLHGEVVRGIGESRDVVFLDGDMVVLRDGEKLFSYDLNTEVSRELGKTFSDHLTRRFPYVNSLVSI